MRGRKHNKRVIVCAACRSSKTGAIFAGARHFDPIMHSQINAVTGDVSTPKWHEILGPIEQGFIDNRYNFLTRQEAMILAKSNGRNICIENGCGGNEDILFSEGIY